MPSLGDSAVIIVLGLLLFGPKGLAQIARQLGKLMAEFRRASNEFRMQMEEELRVSEQADRQKQIAAIETAAPIARELPSSAEEEVFEHPHLRVAPADTTLQAVESLSETVAPLPIATSGDLSIMPPATGLPAPRSAALAPLFDSVPRVEPASGQVAETQNGAASGGTADGSDQRPDRYTGPHVEHPASSVGLGDSVPAESVHG